MDLFRMMWNAFSLGKRTLQELIEISSLVDAEKSSNGVLLDATDELSAIASVIVALMNEKSTASTGSKLYSSINDLIVNMNFWLADSNKGKELYTELKSKDAPGTFKVRLTRTGCKFDLVAFNGEVLVTSEVYSSLDSCVNGIESVKRNAVAPVEDQTLDGYQTIKNPKYELYQDRDGEFRFRLKSANGVILAISAGYKSKETCLTCIERVRISADTNEIEKS